MTDVDPIPADPEGVEPGSRTRRGVPGEVPQRFSDARWGQVAVAREDRDPEGVGDTVRGWFKRAHR